MACRKLFSASSLLNSSARRSISTQVLRPLCKEIHDEITHTGQVNIDYAREPTLLQDSFLQYYETDDYRNARFTNFTKYVNQNWAQKLVAEQPVIKSSKRVVYCDGGVDPALGHPRVFINLVGVSMTKEVKWVEDNIKGHTRHLNF